MLFLFSGVAIALNFKKQFAKLPEYSRKIRCRVKKKSEKSILVMTYCPQLEARSSQSSQQECSSGSNRIHPQLPHSWPQGQ